MPPVAAPTAPEFDVVTADQLSLLEEAFQLPAVEPSRPASRRADAVALAVRSGMTPVELATVTLFIALFVGAAALVAISLVG